MLAYLDMLCAALLVREADEVNRLLQHPLAGILPRRVRAEALLIARAGPRGLRAPVNTLHFYHQTAHLVGVHADPEERSRRASPAPGGDVAQAPQLELELSLQAALGA